MTNHKKIAPKPFERFWRLKADIVGLDQSLKHYNTDHPAIQVTKIMTAIPDRLLRATGEEVVAFQQKYAARENCSINDISKKYIIFKFKGIIL